MLCTVASGVRLSEVSRQRGVALRLHGEAVRASFIAAALVGVSAALKLLVLWDPAQLSLLGLPLLMLAYSMALRRRERWARSLGVAMGYGAPVMLLLVPAELWRSWDRLDALAWVQLAVIGPAVAVCGWRIARRLGAREVRALFEVSE